MADQDLSNYFRETYDFIEQCKGEGGRIFVHCNFGKSRSVTIVAAYLMRSRVLTIVSAILLVEANEFVPGFEFDQAKQAFRSPQQGFLNVRCNYHVD